MEVPVNWMAVVVAALANFGIGYAWYSDALFGKQWRKLMKVEGGGKPTQDMMMKMMVMGLGSALIMAYVLTHSTVFAASYLGESGLMLGVMTGFWNWLGYMFPIILGGYLYEKKPLSLIWINGGYWLVSLIVMGIIIALWM